MQVIFQVQIQDSHLNEVAKDNVLVTRNPYLRKFDKATGENCFSEVLRDTGGPDSEIDQHERALDPTGARLQGSPNPCAKADTF